MLANRFHARGNHLERALKELVSHIVQEFLNAYVKEQSEVEWIQRQYINETANILNNWGCDSTCVSKLTLGGVWNV